MKITWRIVWYSVVIWVIAWLLSSVVVLPWFYLVTPILIFWVTFIYFKKDVLGLLGRGKRHDQILALGLAVSIVWFFILLALNMLEVVGPYYFNALFYFSDLRNWFLYPLVLLVPFIYCLMVDNRRFTKRHKKHIGRHSILGF